MNMVFKVINRLKAKRAQIGTSLTWVVAFILIFFILAIFLFFSGSLSVRNGIGNSISGIFASENVMKHQTFFTNSHSYFLLNKKIEFESQNLSLKEVLGGYPNTYDSEEIVSFIEALNTVSFEETRFVFLAFNMNHAVSTSGSSDCVDTGWSNLIVNSEQAAIQIKLLGGICSSYSSNNGGLEYQSYADSLR